MNRPRRVLSALIPLRALLAFSWEKDSRGLAQGAFDFGGREQTPAVTTNSTPREKLVLLEFFSGL
ncbi:MAG: hypothetical protein HYZ23_02150 [Chloroflexi bacterium]|nr:hypothetical protein [Chloroflexota bacterium]